MSSEANPVRSNGLRVSRSELVSVAAMLLGVFILRLVFSQHLALLEAFNQYNLFFEADPNQYVNGISNGRGFGHHVHPGFALLVNVPVRVLDSLVALVSVSPAGTVRGLAPIVLPAVLATLSGFVWWAACVEAEISRFVRVGGVVLFQGSFSEIIFGSIPESYGLAGLLYCILLWMVGRHARGIQPLSSRRVQVTWLAVAVLLSSVTVSNGFICIAAWLALRYQSIPWRAWLLEGALACAAVTVSIVTIAQVDSLVYGRGDHILFNRDGTVNWVKHYVGPSVGKRVAELPAYGLASIAPGSPRRVRNEIAERNHDRHPFAYSFESEHVDWIWVSLTWLATLGALWASRPVLVHSVFFRATFAIIAANVLVHVFWGPEIFLYSQHWLAFLSFAIVRAIDVHTVARKWLISGLVIIIVAWNLTVVSEILQDLNSSVPSISRN